MDIKQQHKIENNTRFGRWARFYDPSTTLISFIRRDVASELVLPRGAKVLDLACGTGAQSIALAQKGYSVVGIDLSPDMLAIAKSKVTREMDITFINSDASHINYPNLCFDASCISFGLHDMPEEIALEVLKEMIRVTKKGGKIVIVDYDSIENRRLAFWGNKIAKVGESIYYDHFVNTGLRSYLDKVGLRTKSKKSYLLGYFQRVIC